MARLEPRDPVVKALFYANNGNCAFPECPVQSVTVYDGPRQPAVNVEMAHIYAAEQGGPRFKTELSDEFLRSFENLLLLCPNHHKNHVDKDWPNEYTPEILIEMKRLSEQVSSQIELADEQVAQVLTQYREYQLTIQQQTAGSIVNAQDVRQGVFGAELVELLRANTHLTIEAYKAGAESTAVERVDSFNAAAGSAFREPRLHRAIRDPSFHRSTRRAQEAAACTADEDQIDVLVSLLAERAEPDADSTAKIAIDKAYAVVSECSVTATDLLTAVLLAQRLYNRASTVEAFLAGMNSVFEPFLASIPDDGRWFEELKMLDAVRLASGTGIRPLAEFWGERMPGLVTASFSTGSLPAPVEELSNDAKSALFAASAEGELTLKLSSEIDIRKALRIHLGEHSDIEPVFNAIRSNQSTDLVTRLAAAIDEHKTFGRLRTIYNPLPAMEVTPVGKAVAYANLKRRGINTQSIGIVNLSDLL